MIHGIDIGVFRHPRMLGVQIQHADFDGTRGASRGTPIRVRLLDVDGGVWIDPQSIAPAPQAGPDQYRYEAVYDLVGKAAGPFAFVIVKDGTGGNTFSEVINFRTVSHAANIISAQAFRLPGGEILIYETDDGKIKTAKVRG